MSSATYKIVCLSEALAPITHMARSEGNESIVAREPVSTGNGVQFVPFLSGNALRHRLVREPGFRWLAKEYELLGTFTLPQLNFLFHGGNLTEGGGRENTARIVEFQRLFPLGRLLGGTLPDQILAGSLIVGRGTLVCEENRAKIGAMLNDDNRSAVPERLRSAESWVSGYQYTRGDAVKMMSGALSLEEIASTVEGPSNLMIFSGQSVLRGAAFLHEFIAQNVALVELGALLLSLRLWQATGGTIGGQSARGHGLLGTSLLASEFDQEQAVAAYLDHAKSVKSEAVAWLRGVFAPKAEKAERTERANGKGGKKSGKTTLPVEA